MPIFSYADLTDSRTMTYKTFDRHHQSFERREKQLEREKTIINGLTMKMQELGTITYDQYNAVIAWMNHSDKPWYEIFEIVFRDDD
jgi:hypothetical protein